MLVSSSLLLQCLAQVSVGQINNYNYRKPIRKYNNYFRSDKVRCKSTIYANCLEPIYRLQALDSLIKVNRGKKYRLPTTTKELDQFCNRMQKVENCINSYGNQCLDDDFSQKFIHLITTGANRFLRKACKTDSGRKG